MGSIFSRCRRRWPRLRFLFRWETVFVLAIVGFYVVEDFRGYVAWRQAVARAHARDFSIDIEDYLPPVAPPGERSFFDSEYWRDPNRFVPQAQWGAARIGVEPGLSVRPISLADLSKRGDSPTEAEGARELLEFLSGSEQTSAELSEHLSQPVWRRHFDYSSAWSLYGAETMLLDDEILALVNFYRLRATCYLELGESANAFADVQTLSGLASHVAAGSTAIEIISGLSILRFAGSLVADGLTRGAWGDKDLELCAEFYRSNELFERVGHAGTVEHLAALYIIEKGNAEIARDFELGQLVLPSEMPLPDSLEVPIDTLMGWLTPDGWFYQNAAAILDRARIITIPVKERSPDDIKRFHILLERRGPIYDFLPDLLGIDNSTSEDGRMFEAERRIVLSLIAAEQYRRQKGSFPGKMESTGIDPDLLRDPFDPTKELGYSKTGNRIVIWSIGHDGIDQGGEEGDIWKEVEIRP